MIFEEAYPNLLSYAKQICRRIVGEDGDDIAAEVLISLYKNLDNIHHKAIYSWIRRTSINKSINFKRSSGQKYVKVPLEAAEMLHDDSIEPCLSMDFNTAISILSKSPGQAKTVIMRHEGYSFKEISIVMGSSEVTARTQYMKGVNKMKTVK